MINQRRLIFPILCLLSTAKYVAARRNDSTSHRLAEPSYYGKKEAIRYLKGIAIDGSSPPSSQLNVTMDNINQRHIEDLLGLGRPEGAKKGKSFRLLEKKGSKKDKTPKKSKSPKAKGKKNKKKKKQMNKRKQKDNKTTSQPTSSATTASPRTASPTAAVTRAPIAVPRTSQPTSAKTRAPTDTTNSPTQDRQVRVPKPEPDEPIFIPGPDDDLLSSRPAPPGLNDDLTF